MQSRLFGHAQCQRLPAGPFAGYAACGPAGYIVTCQNGGPAFLSRSLILI